MNKEIICVIGTVRSGTSLTTNVIHELGYYLGQDGEILQQTIDGHNPRGYFERHDINKFHNRLMKDAGCDFLKLGDPLKIQEICHTRQNITKARTIIEAMFKHSPKIVFKDPRMVYFISLWQHTGLAIQYVRTHRNIKDIAKSEIFWPQHQSLEKIRQKIKDCAEVNHYLDRSLAGFDCVNINFEDYFTKNGRTVIARTLSILLNRHYDEIVAVIDRIVDPKVSRVLNKVI